MKPFALRHAGSKTHRITNSTVAPTGRSSLAAVGLAALVVFGSAGAKSPAATRASVAAGSAASVAAGSGATVPATQIAFGTSVPGGGGFWEVLPDGQVVTQGSAAFYGDASSLHLTKPIVAMSGVAS